MKPSLPKLHNLPYLPHLLHLQLPSSVPARKERSLMAPFGIGLGGMAVGAALVYLLDPERGARRRAEVKQKTVHAAKEASNAVGVSARDIAHRSRGIIAEIGTRVGDIPSRIRGLTEDDTVLAERVRAKLGRVCSHPRAIEVKCRDGRVVLKGPILKAEVNRLLRGVAKVRGVCEIDYNLEAHESAGNVPGLQGGEDRHGQRSFLAQDHWSPATRTLLGSAGAGLLTWAAARRSLLGLGVGSAVLLRSVTNVPVTRLVGIGAGARAIDLQKHIYVHAPVEEVFGYFSEFENFPRFMTHVRSVSPQDEQGHRWRWSVTGPGGVPVSWDAELTECVPNEVIAWESVRGSILQNAGRIRFEPDREGTRIGVRISYNPPGGAIGHAIVTALGKNPKQQLDDDMIRFKSLLETGRATGREGTITKDDLVTARSTRPLH